MTHTFDPPFVPLPLDVVLTALVNAQHDPAMGVEPAVLDSALDHMRSHGPGPAGLPKYEPRPGRWDVHDTANRGPQEPDAVWQARRVAAATYWAAEDRREQEAAAAAYYASLDAKDRRRQQNREAQARYRAKHAPAPPADVVHADQEVERLTAQVKALQAALTQAQEQLRHARALRASRLAAHAATLNNQAATPGA
jgi:hypothetical protein